MNASAALRQIGERPRVIARIAGVFYLLTFVVGSAALYVGANRADTVGIIAGLCYLGVTVFFYVLFKPVNRTLAMVAAIFSVAGVVGGALKVQPEGVVVGMVCFGFYCLLIGYLIFRSTFLPRVLGVLMAFAGLGWLTFLFPALVHQIAPFNLLPGVIGEGALTLWLLAFAVNAKRWWERAGDSRAAAITT